MRESIGSISLLNYILFFIFLIFAFLMGTFSYYKAYRVNNAIVASIEKFEGFNQYSYDEITEKLDTLAYERVNFNCPETKEANNGTIGSLMDGSTFFTYSGSGMKDTLSLSTNGYCVYMYDNDVAASGGVKPTTDQYDTYEVVTVITFKFPVIQSLLKLRVSSRTGRIFYFN